MSADEKAKRKQLFGKFGDGFQPLKPYIWQLENRDLVEIPVTTFPILKTPIHASYILYLSSFSRFAARQYFDKAMKIAAKFGHEPSILLHPLDFLCAEDAPELKFFPAMNLPLEQKLETMNEIFDCLQQNFRVVHLAEHARSVRQTKPLAVRSSFERSELSFVRK
jgi:hypothetical protein